MRFQVLVFGAMAAASGAGSVTVTVRDGATVQDVLAALGEQHPSLHFALPGARLAVNSKFAPASALVSTGDEVALIALVSGG